MTLPIFTLRILPAAARQITEQADYYRLRESPALAKRWRAAVNDSIRSLSTLPKRGALIQSELPALRNMRRLPIEGFPKHFLFYRLDSDTASIAIVHMLHGSRDIETLFADPQEN